MRTLAPTLALVLVTAVWGYTFVPVQQALESFPLFAFLAARFFVSSAVLAPFAWRPLRKTPRAGIFAGLSVGLLLALAYGLQTAGLELTTVAGTGFITGLYVVFTPLVALLAFGTRVPLLGWAGIALALVGLVLLFGVPSGSAAGNMLVLGNALAQALQIAAMERFAPRYDPRVLTFLQMLVTFAAFLAIAAAAGQIELPHTAQAWYAVAVTGVFAGALGYLVAAWVQARTTAARAALVFTLEAPFAALFGALLLSEHLGWVGWTGCAVMLGGIVLAEPAAARVLRRLAGPDRAQR